MILVYVRGSINVSPWRRRGGQAGGCESERERERGWKIRISLTVGRFQGRSLRSQTFKPKTRREKRDRKEQKSSGLGSPFRPIRTPSGLPSSIARAEPLGFSTPWALDNEAVPRIPFCEGFHHPLDRLDVFVIFLFVWMKWKWDPSRSRFSKRSHSESHPWCFFDT